MAPSGYTIKIPKGNPDDLLKVVGNLRKMAGDADGHGGILSGEAKGMHRASWKDGAGAAAEAEASALSTACKSAGKDLGSGASALSAFARVLDDAKTKIKALDAQSNKIPAEAKTEAEKNPMYAHESAADRQADIDAIIKDKMAPIMKKVHHWEHELDHAAKTCAGKLQKTVGAHKGQSPATVYAQSYNGALKTLPTMAAWQAKQDAKLFRYQMKHGFKNDANSKAMYARIAAESHNPAYADAFARELGADGLVSVPEALVQAHLNNSLTDAQRKSLMSSISNIIGVATNTKNNTGHLDQSEIDKLVKYASNTHTVDPGERGGQWRPSWAMAQLLGYSTNWSPRFLSNVSAEIYDHRGELRKLDQLPDELQISSADDKYIHTDPMLTALEKLGRNGDAGRLFFDHKSRGDLDRLRNLMSEYPSSERGHERILMRAVNSAATQDLPDPTDKHLTAAELAELRSGGDVASYFLHYAAMEKAGKHNDNPLGAATKRTVGSVLGYYYDDLHTLLAHHHQLLEHPTDPGAGPLGLREGKLLDSALGSRIGPAMSYAEVKSLLGDVIGDSTARHRILAGAAAYADIDMQNRMDPANYARGHHDKTLNNVFGNYGSDVGRILNTAYGEKINEGEKTEATKEAFKLLWNVGSTIAAPEGKAASTGFTVFNQIAGGAFDHGDNPADAARADFDNSVNAQENQVRGTVAEMLLHHNEWPHDQSNILAKHYTDKHGIVHTNKNYHPEWWDAKTGHFRVPTDPHDRAKFENWLQYDAGVDVSDPKQAFDDELKTATGG
ncbi:MAG TPA: hypothetical protein VHC49_14945 [Mycobacteriales bacterium]|nr:hypothetical protein [Mycobacteriales bacterium]